MWHTIAMMKKLAINEAIERAGGIVALSKALNVKGHAVVHNWRLTQVPAKHCPDIEKLTGVRCEELRPDVNWSVLRTTQVSV